MNPTEGTQEESDRSVCHRWSYISCSLGGRMKSSLSANACRYWDVVWSVAGRTGTKGTLDRCVVYVVGCGRGLVST